MNPLTPRQIVTDTLNFKNTSHRTARDLWSLPWAWDRFAPELRGLSEEYPSDFAGVSIELKEQSPVSKGDMHDVGKYVDPWGCTFENIQRGVIGEVKTPLVQDDEWEDSYKIHIPEEQLSFSVEQVNREIARTDKFVMLGCPRPFEQLQFIRGTENLYIDLMDPPVKMLEFMERMHDFYCRLLTKYAQTNCDALNFMDDWGSQRSLLINPELWKKYFLPMYRDYIEIARKYGKRTFMHSDGYIMDIIPYLIDIGLDAVNSQIFCMGINNLKQFKGKITFWGEIDRQHLLPYGTPADIDDAVRQIYDALYDNGGCIAQCEFGPGGKFENVRQTFVSWDKLTAPLG